ncbi:MAG TPA: helix-turn-helix domain-containing protein, partial [Dehalococcoidia bacterium]|nr:helix-turn-helix domain-containing protein [Dehalococcoidia bacterium]
PAPVINLTRRRAFEMFRDGMSIAEVAQEIARAPGTAAQYLADYIEETGPASVDPWISPETYRRVAQAAATEGMERLKPVFEALGGDVSYEDIRIVLAHLRSRKPAARVRLS